MQPFNVIFIFNASNKITGIICIQGDYIITLHSFPRTMSGIFFFILGIKETLYFQNFGFYYFSFSGF